MILLFPGYFPIRQLDCYLKVFQRCLHLALTIDSPITLSILHRMLSVLRLGYHSLYVDSLLDCSFLLAFYGFLRCGEFTTSSNSFDPAKDVSFSDVSFHTEFFSLSLKHSKAGGACSVIARTNSIFCPFRSMCSYLKIRPPSEPRAPLFITQDNNPMSKSWFTFHLGQIIQRLLIIQ